MTTQPQPVRTDRDRDLEPMLDDLAEQLGLHHTRDYVNAAPKRTLYLDRDFEGYVLCSQGPDDRVTYPFGTERVTAGEMRRTLARMLTALRLAETV